MLVRHYMCNAVGTAREATRELSDGEGNGRTPPFELLTALPAVPKLTVKLDDEHRPTVGRRRAFFVVNQSSKSSLRSSGVPVPSSHQPPETNSAKPQDADAEYVVNSSRKWEKSRALPRIDDEDVPDNSRPNVDLEAQEPPKPAAKKSGMRVFFTVNPSPISSSSISSRSLSQAYEDTCRECRSEPIDKHYRSARALIHTSVKPTHSGCRSSQ